MTSSYIYVYVFWVCNGWFYLYYILHAFIHRQSDNHSIAPMLVKQPWNIWISVHKCAYCGSVRAHCIFTTKQTKRIDVFTYHFQSFNGNTFTNQCKLPALFYSAIPHKSGIFVQANGFSYRLIDDMSWKLVWLPASRFFVSITNVGIIITCSLNLSWALYTDTCLFFNHCASRRPSTYRCKASSYRDDDKDINRSWFLWLYT